MTMDQFYFNVIDSNIISCLIIFLIIFNLKISNRSDSYSSRSMLMLCWSTEVLLIIDTLAWIFLGLPGKTGFFLVYLSNFLLFFLNPLPPVIWLNYILVNFREGDVTRKEKGLMSLPMIINALVMIYSLFSGFVFTVDGSNQYHRGPGLLVVALLDYSSIVAAVYLSFIFRERTKKRLIRTVIIFSILPLVGSLFQICFYGISTSWPSMAVGVLMTYIFIEVQQDIRDHLTGLLNRKKIEEIVSSRITRYTPEKAFTIIVIDMNDFKSINDNFGHSEGDRALQAAAMLISHSVQSGDFVARIGGDEFVILLDSGSEVVIDAVTKRIQSGIEKWNSADHGGFRISLSMGYAVYDPVKFHKYKDFFQEADKMMYQDKRRRKLQAGS